MAYGDMGRLRRHPGYPLFYATATLTRFADEMFSVGVVLLVLHRTGQRRAGGGDGRGRHPAPAWSPAPCWERGSTGRATGAGRP